jgi:hypothetical protein
MPLARTIGRPTVYLGAQRAVFLATAHPYNDPSFLHVASQVPGWGDVFTAGFTDAMLVLAAVAGVAVVVAFVDLRARGRGP